jgi:hypothetical protein
METIKPDKTYNLKGLIRLGIFEKTLGFKSYPSCLNFILKDRAEKNGGILKAEIVGEGKRTLYIMRGKNIINFLKMYDDQNAKENKKENN